MITTNIHDAKTNLSKLIALAEAGEKVIICKNNVPCAELLGMSLNSAVRPKAGAGAKDIVIHNSFYDPLPADLAALYNGEAE